MFESALERNMIAQKASLDNSKYIQKDIELALITLRAAAQTLAEYGVDAGKIADMSLLENRDSIRAKQEIKAAEPEATSTINRALQFLGVGAAGLGLGYGAARLWDYIQARNAPSASAPAAPAPVVSRPANNIAGPAVRPYAQTPTATTTTVPATVTPSAASTSAWYNPLSWFGDVSGDYYGFDADPFDDNDDNDDDDASVMPSYDTFELSVR